MRIEVVIMAFAVAGCGGRTAMPVAVNNSFDQQLSCAHIVAEHGANRRRVADLTGERNDRARNNLGAILVAPHLLDVSHTIRNELSAIEARDQVLATLAGAKDCAPLTRVADASAS